jgi:hypothetical protein
MYIIAWPGSLSMAMVPLLFTTKPWKVQFLVIDVKVVLTQLPWKWQVANLICLQQKNKNTPPVAVGFQKKHAVS